MLVRALRAGLLFVALVAARPVWAAQLTVYFLDVGQGDAELIVSPTGKTVLIDGGPPEAVAALRKRLGELLVAPLDLVLLTHPHLDHLGGLGGAIDVKGAALFMDSGYPSSSPPYEHLLDQLQREHIPVKNAEPGRTIDLGGGASLQLLAPYQPFLKDTRSDVNANSVVARLTYGHRHVYFSGDSEAETEALVLQHGGELQSDVYKVAHHGLKHSSGEAILQAIHPSVAVIEVGAHNDYGHPTSEAIARLEGIGARVLRTDRDGEVRITTDGDSLDVFPSATGGTSAPIEAPAVEKPTPQATSSVETAAPYLASRRSHVFHRGSCAAVQHIEEANRMSFSTRDAAISSGRTPAKDCKP